MNAKKKLQETHIWWWVKVILYGLFYVWLFQITPRWTHLFILHWYLSLLVQSALLHRYASHETYTMSKTWMGKVGFILCWIFQGPSYLSIHAYGILHKLHHRYTDTHMDVHSPSYDTSLWRMMKRTAKIYFRISSGNNDFQVDGRHYTISEELRKSVPSWKKFDTFAESWFSRISWGTLYVFFYIYIGITHHFSVWLWILAGIMILIHWGMGPIHGAIINWWGHLRGYRNHETKDTSRNIGGVLVSFPMNLLMIGEDLHNNHHHSQYSQNFAHRWWEFDVTHTVLWLADVIGVISFKKRTPLV